MVEKQKHHVRPTDYEVSGVVTSATAHEISPNAENGVIPAKYWQ